MADSPADAPADAPAPSGTESAKGSPPQSQSQSPPRSPRHRNDLDDELLKGAAWAPPWTAHELHSRDVYARSKTPSPPCEKYKRDAVFDETNPEVVKRREEESTKSLAEAKNRHKHQGIVMQRAREFEQKSREQCDKYTKQMLDYKGRMKKREEDSKPPYKNRAEQITALGLNKKLPSRPQSPQK